MVVINSQLTSPQAECDEIIKCVRSSNLHFSVQETPFSLYVTVRKKLVRNDVKAPRESEILLNELAITKENCNSLAQKNYDIRIALKVVEDEKKCLKMLFRTLASTSKRQKLKPMKLSQNRGRLMRKVNRIQSLRTI